MYNYYPQNDMNWCQGEVGAKSFPVAPGHTVPIFDSEDPCLYIKSVDIMGRPLPLKILDYIERDNTPKIEAKNYVEKDTFDEAMTSLNEKFDDLMELITKPEKKEKANAK